MGWPDRYASVAAAYDLVSGEPVYRLGRQVGIDALDLRPGDRVLDIGCGTGLNFELLKQSIGADGRIVGVDLSAQMLAQAARRVERREWGNVILVRANVETLAETDLSGSDLSGSDLSGSDRSGADLAHAASVTAFPAFDAVLFTRHATPSAPLGSTPGSAGLCAMPKGADLRAVLDDGLACGLAARARARAGPGPGRGGRSLRAGHIQVRTGTLLQASTSSASRSSAVHGWAVMPAPTTSRSAPTMRSRFGGCAGIRATISDHAAKIRGVRRHPSHEF